MKSIIPALAILALSATLIVSPALLGQTTDTVSDTTSDMPALRDFHTVVYKIWHDAWPRGDAQLLAQLQPDVEKLGNAIVSSDLPGMLREKKAAWDTAIADFRKIMQDYKAAAAPLDSAKLLAAAERLHSQYELLVRVIRPALREMDDFHKTLYVLFHYQMPKDDMEGIRSSVAVLKDKMVVLDKATLPDRLKSKERGFNTARARLSKSVTALDEAVAKGTATTIKARINTMHSNYQLLEKVFD